MCSFFVGEGEGGKGEGGIFSSQYSVRVTVIGLEQSCLLWYTFDYSTTLFWATLQFNHSFFHLFKQPLFRYHHILINISDDICLSNIIRYMFDIVYDIQFRPIEFNTLCIADSLFLRLLLAAITKTLQDVQNQRKELQLQLCVYSTLFIVHSIVLTVQYTVHYFSDIMGKIEQQGSTQQFSSYYFGCSLSTRLCLILVEIFCFSSFFSCSFTIL